MSLYGFVATTKGRNLFAKLGTGIPLEITRIAFGTGKLPDDATVDDMKAREDLVEYFADGTATTPIVEGDTVSCVLEFRNDLGSGLKETIWIQEYGVFANDPDEGEILILYGYLGDYPDAVMAYDAGFVVSRDYPISVVVGDAVEVVLDFTASAYITAEEATEIMESILARAVLLDVIDISIAAEDWKTDSEPKGEYGYTAEIENDSITEDRYPDVTIERECMGAAAAAGLCPEAETEDGVLKLYAQSRPETTITGICKLWRKGGLTGDGGGDTYVLPTATSGRLGGVKVGDYLDVGSDGTLSVNVSDVAKDISATDEEMDEVLKEALGEGKT